VSLRKTNKESSNPQIVVCFGPLCTARYCFFLNALEK